MNYSKYNILISGSLAYDRIMDFPGKFSDHILPNKIHQINLSFAVPRLKEKFGGTAGNIAYSLALLGFKPLILARAGNDFTIYEKWLKKNKLPLVGINKSKTKPTASAYIITDKQDNQIAGFNLGAMLDRTVINRSLIKNNSIAIIAPDLPENMINLAEYYARKNILFIFDPGQQLIQFNGRQLRKFISQAEIFISNDYELSLFLDKTKMTEKQLLQKVPILVTTLGSKGSLIKQGSKVIKIKSVKLKKVIDPTGAGDAYRAGFIAGLALGMDLKKCGALGSVSSSFAVENYGTQEHKYSLIDFNRRLYKNFGFKL